MRANSTPAGGAARRALATTSTSLAADEAPKQRADAPPRQGFNAPRTRNVTATESHAAAVSQTGWRQTLLRLSGYYSEGSVQMRVARILYEACSAQAESDALRTACALPDDFTTRFNLLVLHMWMCLVRMRQEGEGGAKVSQMMYDMWVEDMEDKLAQQDFKWLEISKFVKEFQHTFYGASFAYDQALQGDDSALASALYRNIFNEQTDAATVARTVGYVRQQLAAVDGVGEEFMSDGVTPWK